MRIYQNSAEAIREIERELFEMGVRVQSSSVQDKDVHDDPKYETVEMFGYGFTIADLCPDPGLDNNIQSVLMSGVDYMKERYGTGNPEWAKAEFYDRVAEGLINPGSTWKKDRHVWETFLRDGRFSYTYNERLREQLPFVRAELKKRPSTRHAIATMYDRHQDTHNWGGRDRVPCTMHYQWVRRPDPADPRQDQLHCVYVMRSCDFVQHLAHDLFFAGRMTMWLSSHVAEASRPVRAGRLTMFVGSLHAFRKDLEGKGIF